MLHERNIVMEGVSGMSLPRERDCPGEGVTTLGQECVGSSGLQLLVLWSRGF